MGITNRNESTVVLESMLFTHSPVSPFSKGEMIDLYVKQHLALIPRRVLVHRASLLKGKDKRMGMK
jgi:hypothetical protein